MNSETGWKLFESCLKLITRFEKSGTTSSTNEVLRAINGYFKALNFFANGDNVKIEISFGSNREKPQKADLIKEPELFLWQIVKTHNINVDGKFEIFGRAQHKISQLLDGAISEEAKTRLISFELEFCRINSLDYYMLSDDEFCNYIKSRHYFLQTMLTSNSANTATIKLAKDAYLTITNKYISTLNRDGMFIQASAFLKRSISPTMHVTIIPDLLRLSLNYDLTNAISSKSDCLAFLEEYEDSLTLDELSNIENLIEDKWSMAGEIHRFTMSKGSFDENFLQRRDLNTVINFNIPYNLEKHSKWSAELLNGNARITILPVHSLRDDLLYRRLADFNFFEIPWRYFAGIDEGLESGYSSVFIEIKDVFLPHLEITQSGQVKSVDFSEQKAVEGREPMPIKEFAVKCIRDAQANHGAPLNATMKDVDSRSFSHYTVDFISENGEFLPNFGYYDLFTTPDSFSSTASRVIDRIEELNLSSDWVDLKELLGVNRTETAASFHRVIKKIIEIVCVRQVERDTAYKLFWKDGPDGLVPKSEVDSHAVLSLALAPITKLAGIHMSREQQSAGGNLDFHFHKTASNVRSLKVCVEVKLAHSRDIEKGFLSQLPAYMKSEGTRKAIYLVLWFKGDKFDYPSKFSSPDDLKSHLESLTPELPSEVIVLNCNKPIPPSKLTAN